MSSALARRVVAKASLSLARAAQTAATSIGQRAASTETHAHGETSALTRRMRSTLHEPSSHQPRAKPRVATSALDAVSTIKSGDSVFIHGTSATPDELVTAMTEHVTVRKVCCDSAR